jgi:hypothetical protein
MQCDRMLTQVGRERMYTVDLVKISQLTLILFLMSNYVIVRRDLLISQVTILETECHYPRSESD